MWPEMGNIMSIVKRVYICKQTKGRAQGYTDGQTKQQVGDRITANAA